DPTPRPKPASPRWIALAALVILAAGLAVAARQWRPPGVPSPAAPGARSPLRDPIHVALKQAGGEDEKSRWVDDLPEVDLAALSKAKRELFLRVVNTRRCTCGCGYTLAACRIRRDLREEPAEGARRVRLSRADRSRTPRVC